MNERVNPKETILFLIVLFFALGLIVFGYSFSVIYKGVKTACIKTQGEYQEERVGSLVKYVQSQSHTLRERNTAVWALGQLADKKALPFLL